MMMMMMMIVNTLRMFENKVLRRIFGPKREEAAGEWTTLHDELHGLYSLFNFIFLKGTCNPSRAFGLP
jgi:hypothetical protein